VRDNPRSAYAPPSCIDTYGRGAPECDVPRADLYPDGVPAGTPSTVSLLDLSDVLCLPTLCPPEIGRVFVYLDDNRLTATFTALLAPVVGPRIGALIGS
jgi:hypothetical protein